MDIELVEGAVPYRSQLYPMPRTYRAELRKWIDENLATGRIYRGHSPWASPLFFKKEDDKLWPVVNYQALNKLTKKKAYLLLLIREILDRLKRFRYFTKLDVRKGFNNIWTTRRTEELLAFICEDGHFLCRVMPFGVSNAPAIFQSLMDALFRILVTTGHVFVYVDDILIAADTLEELREYSSQVFSVLRDNNLTVNPSKCEFKRTQVTYLGVVISQGTIEKSKKWCSAIDDWPIPKSACDARKITALGSYYRRMIPGYAGIAAGLHALTGKGEFNMMEAGLRSFHAIKQAIKDSVQVAIPLDDQPWWIETDASEVATSRILYQRQENGTWKMVDCISTKLQDAQLNYDVYDLEMLAIIQALEEWQHYLHGQEFEIHTDHQNLAYFWKPNPLNGQQNRGRQFLSKV